VIEIFQSELFDVMTSPGDLFAEVSRRLDQMRIDSSPDEVSPMSDNESRKKQRPETMSVCNYLCKSGTIFDPLLYLRVQNDESKIDDTPVLADESIQTPSLDAILEMGHGKAGLMIQTGNSIARPKPVHPRPPSSSSIAPLKESPKLPIAVFRFIQSNDSKVIALPLSRTYRSIAFSKNRDRASDTDPWEVYIRENNVSHYRLCHSLYFSYKDLVSGEEGRLIVIVPHTSRKTGETDVEFLSGKLGLAIRRASLSQVERELGFPTFVCPPFGHKFSPKQYSSPEAKLRFKTVIDSGLTKEAKTDCVFDLGIVAMRVRPGELKRLAVSLNWEVLDNIVRMN
jgi:hypothetical protein